MTHTPTKINAVVLHRGPEVARFPVLDAEDARGFISDMILEGFRAGHVGDEVHLFAPEPPPPDPLPKVVSRSTGQVPRVVPPAQVPVSRVVPMGTTVVPTPDNVVSLAAFRDRPQSRRDVLVVDGGAQ